MNMGEPVKLPMKKGLGQTDRTDRWWKGPTAMAAYLGIMLIYATWRGFMEADFWIFSEIAEGPFKPENTKRLNNA